MMKRLLPSVLLAILAGAAGGWVKQQQPGDVPATGPATAPADAPVAVVTFLEGSARARNSPTSDWEPIKVGMRLPQGAEIQTGVTGRVVCLVPPGRDFIVDRLSRVTLLEAGQQGNKLTTDLLMEYGRTDLRVQKAGYEQDARIRSPGATASVKGTETSLYNQPPFAPELKTYTGVVDYRFAKRQLTVAKGGRSSGGRATAETALLASVVDPSVANARTNADAALITQEVSRGAVVNYNPDIQLAEIRGGAGALNDAQLLRNLPGRLNFTIRWTGDADVDVFVAVDARPFEEIFVPGGDATFNPKTILYPGFGLQTSPSGGRIPYNHRGGRNGGQEICFWPQQFPTGVFGFSALNNSTTTPAEVRFNAFLDGEKVPLYAFDPDLGLIRANGIRQTIQPLSDDPNAINSASTIVPVPRSELFELIFPESPDQTLDGTLPAAAPAPPEEVPTDGSQAGQTALAKEKPKAGKNIRASAQKATTSKPSKPAAVRSRESRPGRNATPAVKPQARGRNR